VGIQWMQGGCGRVNARHEWRRADTGNLSENIDLEFFLNFINSRF
jgi:hypothetical protein